MNDNSITTTPLKCPFRATLITRSFSCKFASEVTRREGPDIGCSSDVINQKCVRCFAELKTKALPELGHEDDLTSMPASVLQKIQFGGLLALQSQLSTTAANDTIDDISALIESLDKHYGGVENIPFDQCVDAISNYKIKRRRDR